MCRSLVAVCRVWQAYHVCSDFETLDPTVSNVAPPSAAVGATITVTVAPPVLPEQRVVLLLGDRAVPAAPLPAGAASSATVDFVLPDPQGTHLLRIRVDGAESRLDYDPASNTVTGPSYVVTP